MQKSAAQGGLTVNRETVKTAPVHGFTVDRGRCFRTVSRFRGRPYGSMVSRLGTVRRSTAKPRIPRFRG